MEGSSSHYGIGCMVVWVNTTSFTTFCQLFRCGKGGSSSQYSLLGTYIYGSRFGWMDNGSITIEGLETSKVGPRMNNLLWLNLSSDQRSLISEKKPAILWCCCWEIERRAEEDLRLVLPIWRDLRQIVYCSRATISAAFVGENCNNMECKAPSFCAGNPALLR